jgi:hypothetical protein
VAQLHGQANSVNNIGLTFLNAALGSSNVAGATGLSPVSLSIAFTDPVIAVYSTKNFSEAVANNGTITGTATITLTGDTWTTSVPNGNLLTAGVHYTATNVPNGLTLEIRKTSINYDVVTISFVGSAQAHAQSNSLNNIGLTFLNAAVYSNNSAVINNLNTTLGITFTDPVSTSVQMQQQHKQWYLNQGQQSLYLEVPATIVLPASVLMRVWDIRGSLVLERREQLISHTALCSIAELPSGYYTLELLVDGKQHQAASFLISR